VVVLERERTLGFHSTGRSAAIFTECYGVPVGRRLALASRSFLTTPPDGFTDREILSRRGIMFPASHAQAPRVAASVVEQQALVPGVRRLTTAAAVELCPVMDPDYVAAAVLEPDAMDIDVHALHTAYQRGIRARGGQIRASTGMDDASRKGGRWVIRSGADRIEAKTLVDAAGAWCDVVATDCGVTPIGLVPKRRTAFTFPTPMGTVPQDWPMVIDFDEQWYFKPEGPHVLGSPCDAEAVKPQDVRHREEDVALGIERIESATTLSIRTISSAWAGLRSFVADDGPVNGWDDRVEGFYWLAGQGGFGIKSSPAMGRFAAGIIATGAPPADLVDRGLTPAVLGVERLR
jgi:D-arginine dehydrogenase